MSFIQSSNHHKPAVHSPWFCVSELWYAARREVVKLGSLWLDGGWTRWSLPSVRVHNNLSLSLHAYFGKRCSLLYPCTLGIVDLNVPSVVWPKCVKVQQKWHDKAFSAVNLDKLWEVWLMKSRMGQPVNMKKHANWVNDMLNIGMWERYQLPYADSSSKEYAKLNDLQ